MRRCAADFITTVHLDDIRQLLKTFQGIADHYKMPLLEEHIAWIFKISPNMLQPPPACGYRISTC